MPMDELQRKLVEAALASKVTATRGDLLRRFPLEINVSSEYTGYLNPRVTIMVDDSVAFEVTHLKFTPVPEAGYVVVQASLPGEPGAELFTRGDSGRTGVVPMKAALHGFQLTFPDDLKLKLPVEPNTVTIDGEERTVVMMQVKRPARKKKLLRPRKKTTEAATRPAPTPEAALAPGKQPESEAKKPELEAKKPEPEAKQPISDAGGDEE